MHSKENAVKEAVKDLWLGKGSVIGKNSVATSCFLLLTRLDLTATKQN